MSSLVQAKATNPGNGTATTIAGTFDSNVTAGNLLLVGISWEPLATREIQSVQDSLGNSFQLIDAVYDATQDQKTAWYYARKVAGGADTITVTFTLTVAFRRLIMAEVATTTDMLDQHITKGRTATATGTDGLVSNAIVPSTTDQLIVGMVEIHTGAPTLTPGTGYTELIQVAGVLMQMEFKDLASPVSTEATWTVSAAGSNYLSFVASFKRDTGIAWISA